MIAQTVIMHNNPWKCIILYNPASEYQIIPEYYQNIYQNASEVILMPPEISFALLLARTSS
jgi:hypothetical protein